MFNILVAIFKHFWCDYSSKCWDQWEHE